MVIRDWTEVIVSSLQDLWLRVIGFLPSLVGAFVVFIVGLVVATALGTLVERILSALKIDVLLRSLGIETYVERAGLKLNSGRFIGQIVFWFITLVFLLAAANILGLTVLATFFQNVLLYIPNIVVAVLIFIVALIAARFLSNLVRASAMSARLHASKFLGALTWWAVVIFGFLTALTQLGIGTQLIQTIVMGVIVMFALAGGIAFGLGGRDYASHLIARFREQVEGK